MLQGHCELSKIVIVAIEFQYWNWRKLVQIVWKSLFVDVVAQALQPVSASFIVLRWWQVIVIVNGLEQSFRKHSPSERTPNAWVTAFRGRFCRWLGIGIGNRRSACGGRSCMASCFGLTIVSCTIYIDRIGFCCRGRGFIAKVVCLSFLVRRRRVRTPSHCFSLSSTYLRPISKLRRPMCHTHLTNRRLAFSTTRRRDRR